MNSSARQPKPDERIAALPGRGDLLAAAPDASTLTLAFAGVIGGTARRAPPYNVPVAGLAEAALRRLLQRFFPALAAAQRAALLAQAAVRGNPSAPESSGVADEFADIVALLLEEHAVADDAIVWLAHAIATACMSADHLWQDMDLPDRPVLGRLMREHFPQLAVRNVRDMRWKKFLYRELCDRAAVPVCPAPSCSACSEYSHCFAGAPPAATASTSAPDTLPNELP
ncbi:nitrogen fixation protein NifQ [Rhodocyclus tenuis]|uniref:Nitrogen fixation protein NifQ n=1 Tax=Rhodocyclus tenuis TaxID=1066 RepID=A0A840GBI4_RHOTE|nr:nitrogen fixation protein NifQ [Rhodocyclus tenuis]MBB4248240.1 nitrogen fixation protein NifQ [Rhodocyclus tenuis]